uniref:Phospholipid scramblase n=2 Tax=Rhizophora mucronata TaxID=61149 RepID=A0A2P2JED3_RHIMU
MNRMKQLRFLAKPNESMRSLRNVANKYKDCILRAESAQNLHCLQLQRGYVAAKYLEKDVLWSGDAGIQRRLAFGRNAFWQYKRSSSLAGTWIGLEKDRIAISRQFGHCAANDSHLSRNFLAQLWVADREMNNLRRKGKRKINHGKAVYDKYPSFQGIIKRLSSGATSTKANSFVDGETVLKQPPFSQFVSGYLKPTSPEEVRVAPLLARSNLLITRDIEWANLMLGFEQENRYLVVDVCYPKSPVGFIREQSNVIARQLLRLRRPFVAYIIDGLGNELFRVRRPFWWITSTIYAEINGKAVGVVHRRWHLWRRVYDLYLGQKQFAVVENPGFWNWTFTLKDIDGKVLAQIDRDWRGFGFEIFTDAGQYVIRFGSSDPSSKTGPARTVDELEVVRLLSLSERAVAVALAISLDNDYFSRHGGWAIPFVAVGE